MSGRGVKAVWFGNGFASAAARALLYPAELAFRAGVRIRSAMYDAGWIRVPTAALPAISVGNLTVGGTGKTPVSAWIAGELRRRGAVPAIVLRGYGDDEPKVHGRLNPDVFVVVDPDRAAGMAKARAMGANVAVLDDAFQHRRAARVADVVLVSAERGLSRVRLLPAGPFREPVRALRRASMVLVTRKTADPGVAATVLAEAMGAGGIPGGVVSLIIDGITPAAGGDAVPAAQLGGRRVTLVTGVAEPELVADQLRALGAKVVLHAYPDHHAFRDRELVAAAAVPGQDYVVCTLKDAVKIAHRWPGAAPLWYVSQRLTVERGGDELTRMLDGVLATVTVNPQTAG